MQQLFYEKESSIECEGMSAQRTQKQVTYIVAILNDPTYKNTQVPCNNYVFFKKNMALNQMKKYWSKPTQTSILGA